MQEHVKKIKHSWTNTGCSILLDGMPAQWWSLYGTQYPELQRFAIRILSQTCDGATKYGLQRTMAEKVLSKGRSHTEQQLLSDLTSVHYNLHLQNSQLGVENGIVAEEIDPMDDRK
ncbi:Dimer_Tnp_hAT domain-containing protein [Cephalotus follicularis]|uniref:Dimer_Tnp_hAT domain-containing protein n=1 Tax=Cephalotus follicularis TaxID=3775 RepID=A0A1Q3D6R8_CEPFO|nr:Dimer_Tnp_hAT domain-containing protein [Cephalotus follicularis]